MTNMTNMTNAILIIVTSLLVVALRFTVPDRPVFTWPGSYEALAHIWVGVLICLAVQDAPRGVWRKNVPLWSVAIITVVEVIAAKT